MSTKKTFGEMVKNRRDVLGLTQDDLARRVSCTLITIRKIENDDLQTSVQIAERLMMSLNVPLEERAGFVYLARVEHPTPVEGNLTPMPAPEEIGSEDLTGRAIRGYKLGELIGKGGMGAVYRTIQPLVEREVAIKIILPQYANHADFIRRFEAEAQLVARLEHPNIVPLYDYWRDTSVAYLVMRLMRGGSLQAQLQNGALNPKNVLHIIEQVGAALSAAHRAGVVHRDLKPANVLFDEENNAYLADFGIAKNLNSLMSETLSDEIIGSPNYISPEQVRSDLISPQTDIYSLGVMLYEMLTGSLPFSGPTPVEVMFQHLNEPLPMLAASRTGLSPALDVMIGRATAKDPRQRHIHVDEMLNELRAALNADARAVQIVTKYPSEWKNAADHIGPDEPVLRRPRHNLPLPMTSFIGRKSQIEELIHVLRPHAILTDGDSSSGRLLTLIGPGGCGKTRLAIEAARGLVMDFTDGVCWIELAAITNPDFVVQTITSAMGLREQPNRPLLECLVEVIQSRQILFVLDNCEHLLSACSHLASTLLQSCPHLCILATSRAALNIGGEVARQVLSLTSPDPQQFFQGQTDPISLLNRYESVNLFVDRASAVLPGFSLTNQNFFAIAQICHRLDGIPLAIELAAARVKMLTAEQIANRLDHLFRLLTRGGDTVLLRHQTLRAAVNWSYELLSPEARILLQRLAVFVGGFSLTAVEEICAEGDLYEEDALDFLSDLVDQSMVLVSVREPFEEVRYRLSEMIRQFAQEKLEAAGEEGLVQERHAIFYLGLAEASEVKLQNEDQGFWLSQLELEHNNFRAALEWSKRVEHGTEVGLRITGALWRFWEIRGYFSEGRAKLEAALAHSDEMPIRMRAKALVGAGTLAWHQTDYSHAIAFHERALSDQREMGDRPGIAFSLNNLGAQALGQGEYGRAAQWFEDSLTISTDLKDWRMAGYALHNLGEIARLQGNFSKAANLYEECLSIFRKLKDRWAVAINLSWLGVVTYHLGEYDLATAYLKESLALCQELGVKPSIVEGLEGLAGVAIALQPSQWSVHLLGTAEKLRQIIHSPLSPVNRIEYDQLVAKARAALGEEAFQDAWSTGQAMAAEGWEKVVSYALAEQPYS